jgi:hypothetical protein
VGPGGSVRMIESTGLAVKPTAARCDGYSVTGWMKAGRSGMYRALRRDEVEPGSPETEWRRIGDPLHHDATAIAPLRVDGLRGVMAASIVRVRGAVAAELVIPGSKSMSNGSRAFDCHASSPSWLADAFEQNPAKTISESNPAPPSELRRTSLDFTRLRYRAFVPRLRSEISMIASA